MTMNGNGISRCTRGTNQCCETSKPDEISLESTLFTDLLRPLLVWVSDLEDRVVELERNLIQQEYGRNSG